MRKKINQKYVRNCTPNNDICTSNKSSNIKTRHMLKANEMKVPRKMAGKTKIYKIKIQQIRESCGIQPFSEWMERRIREWDEHVTRVDAKRLVNISIDNILSEEDLQDV